MDISSRTQLHNLPLKSIYIYINYPIYIYLYMLWILYFYIHLYIHLYIYLICVNIEHFLQQYCSKIQELYLYVRIIYNKEMVQWKDKNKIHDVPGKLKHLNKYGMKYKIFKKIFASLQRLFDENYIWIYGLNLGRYMCIW